MTSNDGLSVHEYYRTYLSAVRMRAVSASVGLFRRRNRLYEECCEDRCESCGCWHGADNINGSLVTGQSPFEIWLNEAVTVHIQRQREDMLFGHDFMRLRQVP